MNSLTLHLFSSVSSRLIRTSKPPTSRIASWQVSWAKLKSRIEHRAMIVAVWFPPFKYLTSFCICQYSEGRSDPASCLRSWISSSSSDSSELSLSSSSSGGVFRLFVTAQTKLEAPDYWKDAEAKTEGLVNFTKIRAIFSWHTSGLIPSTTKLCKNASHLFLHSLRNKVLRHKQLKFSNSQGQRKKQYSLSKEPQPNHFKCLGGPTLHFLAKVFTLQIYLSFCAFSDSSFKPE